MLLVIVKREGKKEWREKDVSMSGIYYLSENLEYWPVPVKGGAVMSPTQKHIRPPALGTLYLVCMDRSVTAFHVCTLLSYLLEKSVIRSHT